MELMTMKKIRVYYVMIIFVVFVTSMDTVHAFEIGTVLTTSYVSDGEPCGGEIYFEPGDLVYIYVKGYHCGGRIAGVDMEFVVHGPSGQFVYGNFYSLPGDEPNCRCRELNVWCSFYLSKSDPIGEYTVRVTAYDRNNNTEKAVKSAFYVDYHTANKYLEDANSCFADGNYKEAQAYYIMAKYQYEEFDVFYEIIHCREKIEECDKYMLAEKCCSKADKCLREKDYRNVVYYFRNARDLYAELGDETLVEMCDHQVRYFTIVPSAINLILITLIVYMILKEFKKDKKKEILLIFSIIVILISFTLLIEFYFHKFFYTALFLATIIVALTLKISLKRYRRKIYPNPYIAGNPIRSKEIFFGRKDVFQFIKNKLHAKKNTTIVLHGERRTGKTSVLYQIENGELGKRFVPVYIDIQEMAKVNETEFFIKITEKIAESLTRNEIIDLKSNTYSEITKLMKEYRLELNSYQVFNKFLDKIPNFLGEKFLILMFDEYEILEKKIEEGHLNPDLIRYLRSQMQSRERFSFIFAGSKKLEELEGKHWSLMFNAATYKKISFLNREDALDLMTIPVQNRIHYNNEAINRILQLTACHPYFLQLFLQNLIDHLNDAKKNNVTLEEVGYVLDYLLDNPSPHMIYIWQDSTDEQRLILSALSEIIESEEEFISIKRIEENLGSTTLDADSIKKALNNLYKKEILDRKKNNYKFKIDLLRYWIKTEHPLFRTLEDIQ
jgi:hypothetical protein